MVGGGGGGPSGRNAEHLPNAFSCITLSRLMCADSHSLAGLCGLQPPSATVVTRLTACTMLFDVMKQSYTFSLHVAVCVGGGGEGGV